MAYMFSRTDDGAYVIDDTLDPSKTQVFHTKHQFLYASLVLLLQMRERFDAAIESYIPRGDRIVEVGEIKVFPKHMPHPCGHCGFVLDGCCGPASCPQCGNPTNSALNAVEMSA